MALPTPSSFTEVDPFTSGTISDIRRDVAALEASHRRNGIHLTGRILHICHSLPITCTLDDNGDWALTPRYGHAAMISGIRSLSATHEQLIVGWTGDINRPQGESDPVISQDQKDSLEVALTSYTPKESDPDDDKKTVYVPVWMDSKVAHGYYDGYCKQILWPLFHYLLWQDVATEYASADSHYPFYESANAAFARRIAAVYRPGDLIWVHDYHLLLLPKLIREVLPDAVVGLFVHTPFPSSEVFRCLPRRKEILDGMLGANLVCFQNYSYSRHFISTCIRVCGYESNPRGIDVDGHLTAVSYCPVGVDAERVARDVLRPGIKPKFDALRTLYHGKKIIVGRDKLDVVKGVLQKLRAFEKLLQLYPEWIGKVVMIQVTSPALSDSPKLERQVSELVAHINGEYGSLDFIPCHHYHQTLKKDEFYALLSVADLAVITPLRDGMNTTSMEFVIAQERTKRSPSVLSELMGVMGIMGTGEEEEGRRSHAGMGNAGLTTSSPSVVNLSTSVNGSSNSSSISSAGLGGLAGATGALGKNGDLLNPSFVTPKEQPLPAHPTPPSSTSSSVTSSGLLTPSSASSISLSNIGAAGPVSPDVPSLNGHSSSTSTSPTTEGALWVNPWDLAAVASSINRALLMPEAEKLARHKYLHKVVTTHTSHSWAGVLVQMLLRQINAGGMARRTPRLEGELVGKRYIEAVKSTSSPPSSSSKPPPKRAFFFDYDGTLAPIVKVPSAAVPSSTTLRALRALCADPLNLVYIISGRDGAFLEEHLGDIEGLGFSAEHGAFIREPRAAKTGGDANGTNGVEKDGANEGLDTKGWQNFTAKLDMSWMNEVYEVFRYYTERTTGSHLEVKKSSITWHYRGADPEWGQFQCRQCQDLLENNLAHKRPIEVLVGKKNLEVRPIAVNKGEIVKRILYKNPGVEFIFCAGDDKTDEDMFRALNFFPAPNSPSSSTFSPSPVPPSYGNGDGANCTEGIEHGVEKIVMEAPLSVTLVDGDDEVPFTESAEPQSAGAQGKKQWPTVELNIKPDAVFTVAVGHSSKRTLASWHVTSPGEVVECMLEMVGEKSENEGGDAKEVNGPGEHAEEGHSKM